jgi:hypothetical protein
MKPETAKWFNPAYWVYAGIGMLIVGLAMVLAKHNTEDSEHYVRPYYPKQLGGGEK